MLLSKIYQQDVLTNWRCRRKFCFLFWLLFAEMPRHPLQFFFFSAQNLNVIPISCPGTVCLFHKTDTGGGTTISYCGKLSITHLLWRHAKISEFRYNKKCCQNFRGQRMIFKLLSLHLSFDSIRNVIYLLTHFHFNKRKLSVPKIRMIGAITSGYCHFGGTRCKWYYEAILSHKDKDDDYFDKGNVK